MANRGARLLLFLIALVAQIGFGRPVAASVDGHGHARARDARAAAPLVLGRSDAGDRNARLVDESDGATGDASFALPISIGAPHLDDAIPKDRAVVDRRLARPTARGPPALAHQR